MKKLALFCLIFTFVLVSCNNDDDNSSPSQDEFIGTWKLSQSFENGQEFPLEDCEEETTLIVSSNGNFSVMLYDNDNQNDPCEFDYEETGVWENLNNGMYSLSSEGEISVIDISFSGNTMTFSQADDEDEYTSVFTKQ